MVYQSTYEDFADPRTQEAVEAAKEAQKAIRFEQISQAMKARHEGKITQNQYEIWVSKYPVK